MLLGIVDIQNFLLPGLDRCPADLIIPFAGMNRQDLCLDVTVMASLKANIINKASLEMDGDQHSPNTGFVVWTLGVGGALWGGFAVWWGALKQSCRSQSQVSIQTGDQSQLTW